MFKKIFILVGILLLGFINLPYLKSFYNNWSGKQLFEQKKYNLAQKKFLQANNLKGFYNLGNTFYKQGKYADSIKEYLSILGTGKNELNFRLNHNIGNAYYRFGQKQKNINLKRGYWEKAISYYQNALKIKYNEQTKDNLEFVLKKLKDLKNNKQSQKQQQKNGQKKNQQQKKNGSGKKKQQQNKNGSGKKKNNQNKQGQGKKQESKNGNKQKNASSKNGKKQGEKKQNQGQQGGNKNKSKIGKEGKKQTSGTKQNKAMTEKEKQQVEMMKALQKYQKNLEKEQKQNMQNYGKVYQPPRNNNPFNNPFFTGLPSQNNVKDW